jgi:hypothetical protein
MGVRVCDSVVVLLLVFGICMSCSLKDENLAPKSECHCRGILIPRPIWEKACHESDSTIKNAHLLGVQIEHFITHKKISRISISNRHRMNFLPAI